MRNNSLRVNAFMKKLAQSQKGKGSAKNAVSSKTASESPYTKDDIKKFEAFIGGLARSKISTLLSPDFIEAKKLHSTERLTVFDG